MKSTLEERRYLETVYDWITIAIFAGLVVLFLQRSSAANPVDSIWQYLGAAVGCALANWFGNEAIAGAGALYHAAAVATILGTLAYIYVVLKPLDRPSE